MRIYGKKKEIAPGYYEVEYREYREDGTLKATGTEDFSKERLAAQKRELREVCTWDGKTYNKGGHRWFVSEELTWIPAGELKTFKAYAKARYNKAELVQIRKVF